MKSGLIVLAAILLCSAAGAQERAALGAVETQMTWSALNGQIAAFNSKLDGVNARMDQSVVCAKRGMLYAPGAGDAQGCIEAGKNGNAAINITNLDSRITNATNIANSANSTAATANNTANVANSRSASAASCAASGYLFNGNGCVAIPKPTCTLTSTQVGGAGGHGMSSPGSCASGWTMTGTNGGSTYTYNICAKITCN